jgi:DNA processing protein
MSEVISDIGRTYLRWALIDGVGPLTFSRLLVQLGDPQQALGASAATLQTVKGIGREKADAVARGRDSADADREIEAAAEHGVRIICRTDEDYPPGLKQIPDAPIVLFVKGELRPTDAVALAVVGSRHCTIYGSEQARRFGELLAGAGFTVVSGLARGIDAFAHHGAVDSGGDRKSVV